MAQNPVATFGKPLSTGVNVQDPTTYKGLIDGDMAVLMRVGDSFAAHANSTPDMRVYLDPGHVFTGIGLTEVGADTVGTVTNGSTSVSITGSVAGISGTMLVSGPGIPAGTTATISGTTVTLSQAAAGLASSPQTSAPLRFMQRTAAITAPVSNSRIDRVVVDRITGVASVITGTPGASPAVPALTVGVAPVAQVLLTSSTTAITNSMITDERDLNALGELATSQVTLASNTTTDLGTAKSNNILISGTTTITALGSTATTDSPIYFLTFSGALTLTYNATSLILPGLANITTAANDSLTAIYLGSGNWQVVDYQRANGQTVTWSGTDTTIASATTTTLTQATNLWNCTGTTTITGFGSSASLANPVHFVRFTGALTLTYNGSSMILPSGVNITTAAGDCAIMEYLGSGNWRCLSYQKADGTALVNSGDNGVQDFRLTLTTAAPLPQTDVTGATTIYCCPYKGNRIALYDGSANWNVRTSAQFSLALGTLTSGKPYDVFCYDNAGVPTLEFLVWTNDTGRATPLVYQDGVLVKSGATTRRYMGTFYTTATTTTEDSKANRYLYNYYWRSPRKLERRETNASWTYTTATWRQANAAAANQVNVLLGVDEDTVIVNVAGTANNASANVNMANGIGLDSTTTPVATSQVASGAASANPFQNTNCTYIGSPGLGRHSFNWLEASSAVGTTTFYGTSVAISGSLTAIQGMQGQVMA